MIRVDKNMNVMMRVRFFVMIGVYGVCGVCFVRVVLY